MTYAWGVPSRAIAACGLIVVTLLASTIAAACSDSASVGPGPPPSDGGASFEAQAPDAAASIELQPNLCEGLSRGGDPVPELAIADNPPTPLGGTVIQGTYDLAELNVYTGPPDAGSDDGGEPPPATHLTGQAAQITVVVSEFAMRTVEARGTSEDGGLSPERTHAVLYRVDGTSLLATAVCPTTAAPVPLPFTAVGGGLAIFVDATHRELYVRRE